MIYVVLVIVSFEVYFNMLPLLKRKFNKEKVFEFKQVEDVCDVVLGASKKMLVSNKVIMSFNDEIGLYVKLSELKNWLLNNGNSYQYYNFPRAWLMIGLLDEYDRSGEADVLEGVEQQCVKLIDGEGRLLFEFNKIDQSLFGLVFLRLFTITSVEKYIRAADRVYNFICTDFMLESRSLILYRKESKVGFVDTLGMVCPFLYYYAEEKKNTNARDLANKQLFFFINNALESDSNLPFHALDLECNLKIGPTNWSRGLGWFLIGLSYSLKFSNTENNLYYKSFDDLFNLINKRLDKIKVKGLYWSQFLGHTNDNSVDTSATLMFYYARLTASKKLDVEEFNALLKGSINKKGYIFNSTGDTIYINKYSRQKGYSEITQGLLVSIISNIKQYENRSFNTTIME